VSDDVSRETPPAPSSARGVFAAALPIAEAYAELLATDGVTRGLIGPREAPRLWERHLVNCALLAEAIPPNADVCDIGSGAGLPGLVLAIVRPDLSVTLVEPLLRRTTFLTEAVERLGLSNVEVVRARAEGLHGAREFTVVTSRAVAPLARLLDWSMPLVRQGGALVAMKGSSVGEEVDAAEPELRKHGAGAVTVSTLGEGVIDPPTTVVRVEASRPSRLGLSPGRTGAAERGTGPRSRRKGRKR
jgi:16S rRNA (guanine527-N7)-methyltransferase